MNPSDERDESHRYLIGARHHEQRKNDKYEYQYRKPHDRTSSSERYANFIDWQGVNVVAHACSQSLGNLLFLYRLLAASFLGVFLVWYLIEHPWDPWTKPFIQKSNWSSLFAFIYFLVAAVLTFAGREETSENRRVLPGRPTAASKLASIAGQIAWTFSLVVLVTYFVYEYNLLSSPADDRNFIGAATHAAPTVLLLLDLLLSTFEFRQAHLLLIVGIDMIYLFCAGLYEHVYVKEEANTGEVMMRTIISLAMTILAFYVGAFIIWARQNTYGFEWDEPTYDR